MARTTYTRGTLGGEVQAPWGYYQPMEEGSLEHSGRQVLYTLGYACVEASCCGKGSWDYARVEGYVVGDARRDGEAGAGTAAASVEQLAGPMEIDTVEDAVERASIAALVVQKHPGVRVEFR